MHAKKHFLHALEREGPSPSTEEIYGGLLFKVLWVKVFDGTSKRQLIKAS